MKSKKPKFNASGLSGIDKVMGNLNKELEKLKKRSMPGMIKAAIHIRRSMEDTPPLIPVDLGNLRASWFTVTGTGQDVGGTPQFIGEADHEADHAAAKNMVQAKVIGKPMVGMGFSAVYASAVHENTTAKRQRPGSGGKFFESALKRDHATILKIVSEDMKL